MYMCMNNVPKLDFHLSEMLNVLYTLVNNIDLEMVSKHSSTVCLSRVNEQTITTVESFKIQYVEKLVWVDSAT